MKRILKAVCPVCKVEVAGEDQGTIDDPGFIVVCSYWGERVEAKERRG